MKLSNIIVKCGIHFFHEDVSWVDTLDFSNTRYVSPNKNVGGNVSGKTSKSVRPFSPKTKKLSSKQGRIGGKNFLKTIRVLHSSLIFGTSEYSIPAFPNSSYLPTL